MAESNKMQGSQEHIYRCNEGDFFKFLVCRNQCCLSENLSGTGWRYGITGYFTFETACNHFTIGGDFLYLSEMHRNQDLSKIHIFTNRIPSCWIWKMQ